MERDMGTVKSVTPLPGVQSSAWGTTPALRGLHMDATPSICKEPFPGKVYKGACPQNHPESRPVLSNLH